MAKYFISMIILILSVNSNLALSEVQIKQMMESDGSIMLPSQKSNNLNLTANPVKSKQIWHEFNQENPTWKVFFNGTTGKPHRAFGKPIQISGYSDINADNVLEAAISFLEQRKDLFGLYVKDLKLRKSLEINNLWTLSFGQLYNGLEVLLTEVELRIRKDGKVMAFGINTYDNINIEITPSISQAKAEAMAYEGLQEDNKEIRVQSNEPLYILPVKNGKSVSFGLVREFIVDIPSTNQKFASYVDMHQGSILWRRNLIANIETPVNVKGGVKLNSRFSSLTDENFDNFNFTVNGVNYSTDENGNANVNIESSASIQATMTGKYARIGYDSQTNASFTGTINPGAQFNLLWTDNNSHRFERNLYYHANYAHDFFKMMDPVSKAMDFQLNVTIMNYGQPNAGSDLEQGNIYFYGANQTSMYVVETPSVLYHEYGHSINTRLYKELGISQGMVNSACHEALADLNAGLMTDQPKIGYLAFADTNQSIRNLVNTRKYPSNINGESHNDGMILGGAFWDLRKVTNLDYVRWLVHYTKKMGTPDDENTGIAFFEWFIEALIADDTHGDGDNDMSNGTPYAMQIIESFNKHDIGTKLAMLLSFEHTPYGDTQDTENPYNIQFFVRNPISFLNYEPQNVKIYYSIDGLKTKTEVPAIALGNDNYEANIPAMPKGTIVKYYMSALDKQSNQNVYFSQDDLVFKAFEFLVGYKVGLTEDFENSVGWKVGDSGDDATGGLWEIGIPQYVAIQGFVLQPGSDRSVTGTKCLVTGASNGGGTQQGIFRNMPDGKTTIISPSIDISTTEKPIFSYYRFFSNVAYLGGNASIFRVLASSNGGDNWVQVETTTTPSTGWERTYFPIETFVQKTNRFKVKFEFTGFQYAGYPFYLAEGLVDDIEILTTNDDAKITHVDFLGNQDNINIYPNPFTDFLDISISNNIGIQDLIIFDILGNTIKILKPTNSNNFRWDATDSQGFSVNKGIYFIKFINGNQVITKKIILR